MRLIQHLSYPFQASVNDFIDDEYCTVQYSSFDQILEVIAKLGKGVLLGKMDIKSAFRLLPIQPSDFDLLGFRIAGLSFYYKTLPMGCSISCALLHFSG